jgi:hypothetical protein
MKIADQLYILLKGTDFSVFYQKIGSELNKAKPFTVTMPEGFAYVHTWELQPGMIEKARTNYPMIEPARKYTYESQKAGYLQTLERPGNFVHLITESLNTLSMIIQTIECENRQLLNKTLQGYYPHPDCFQDFGRLWAFCDLFIEFFEIQQAYQAGNTITGFSIGIDRSKLPTIFDDLKGCGYIAKISDYRNFEAILTPLPLPIVTRVRWVKKNKRNRDTAKKALTDMLKLMGVPADQITDKKRLKACFAGDDGQPLTYTSSNFYNSKEYFRHHSEYYPELQKIIIG